MNKQTRKEVAELAKRLNWLLTELDIIISLENDKYDNLPENLLQADRAVAMGETIDRFQDAYNMLENAVHLLENPED